MKKINYHKYKIRVCYSLHHCALCLKDIKCGEMYYDGGYSRRAHVSCVDINEELKQSK